jgi:serine protease AprX
MGVYRCFPLRPLVSLLGSCLVAGAASLAAEDPALPRLRPPLEDILAESSEDRLVPVSIVLSDRVPVERLRIAKRGLGKNEGRRTVVDLLRAHAARTQRPILERLGELERNGEVARIRPLWIGNVVGVDATPAVIREMAARPEVAWINHNPKVDVLLGDRSGGDDLAPSPTRRLFVDPAPQDTIAEIECGVGVMRAPEVWNELGVTGDGAVVAVIDTGVCHTHSDIANQMWVNPGEDLDTDGVVMDPDDMNGIDDDANGFVDDLIGWDFDNGDNVPNDDNSHGSHCAGTVAGDGTAGTQAGMAPDAKIMAVKVGVTFADEVDVWNAMQYAADNGADAISMSLGWPHGQNPDRATWRQNSENTIEAGTAMVIAAGNEGSGNEPDNVRTPGDVPRVITVGATDCSDQIAGFSSRGPVTWEDVPPWNDHPYPPGLVKPDIAAPGVDTKSHNVCSGYSFKSGTSMATPHVAGTVALMVSSSPGLTHDDLKQILMDTAIDLGVPGMDNEYGMGRVDAYQAVSNTATPDGRIRIKEASASCSGSLQVTLTDADLRGAGTVAIEAFSNREPAPEAVPLTETSATSGVFKGTVLTDGGAVASDGKVQVAHADTITVRYVDADDGRGGRNVPKTDTAAADCQGPIISAVGTDAVTDVRATVRWNTDEPSSSLVRWGEGTPPDRTAGAGGLVLDHAVDLTGLRACTVYWFGVESADAPGNVSEDTNGGQYHSFETWGDFGAGLQPCHAGLLSLPKAVVSCADGLPVNVVDLDLNADPTAADTVAVSVSSSSETAPETLILVETGPNTSQFTGSVPTGPTPAVGGDGVVQVAHGDLITATYHDDDNGLGVPAISFETADVDCGGPVISDVRATDIQDDRATIRWTTSEPATSRVDWGTTAGLGSSASDAVLETSHALTIGPMLECGRLHFRVTSADTHGNTASADASGNPFQMNAWRIPGMYRETFEAAAGWTLEGDWQIGVPQGLGTPGDPSAAFEGTKVLGQDLTGLGAHPGDYEPGTSLRAISPVIDATALSGGQLKFRRWLNVSPPGIAYVEVRKGGVWQGVWTSPSIPGVADSAWSLQTIDISQHADANGQLQIAFRLNAGPGTTSHGSSWNVDRLIVKNAAEPDYAACGTCAGMPSFAGLRSATDADGCADGGVALAWTPAPAWGTGSGGTYSVYRSTDPGFVPGPTNRIAAGVTGTFWIDAGAPNDVTLHYVVRAENDETCSTGPHNGGVTDDNLVRRSARDETTQAPPAPLGATVRLDNVNDAHVRLTWDPSAGAASYRIYRANDPQGAWVKIGETAETVFEDRDDLGNFNPRFYAVRGADSCGNEGP